MLIKDDKEISYFIDINFNVGYIKKKDSHTHLKKGKWNYFKNQSKH